MTKKEAKPTAETAAVPASHQPLLASLERFGHQLQHYRVLLFALLLIAIFGFLAYRIYLLAHPASNQAAVDSKVTTVAPSIDPKVIHQLQSLQDNSVNVQALFDQARHNPFAE